MPDQLTYTCRECGADLTRRVEAARQSTLSTYRALGNTPHTSPRPWRVRVICPQGHQNMFEGK